MNKERLIISVAVTVVVRCPKMLRNKIASSMASSVTSSSVRTRKRVSIKILVLALVELSKSNMMLAST